MSSPDEKQKLLFVCTGLEPGRDGVGDYTWRLASELSRRGHSCFLLALADGHIDAPVRSELPMEGGAPLVALRLPARIPWPERIGAAKKFREETAPGWISWQFVIYGYDPRGLSFGLGRRLRAIAGECRNHIMFHELWIGEAEGSPLKHRLVGRLQRFIIRDLLAKLRPAVVHTHTPLYQHLLRGLGIEAARLPLFGNIPLAPHPDDGWLARAWLKVAADRRDWWIFVIFGSIHPEWNAEEFRQRAVAAAQRAGRKCGLVSIGRAGAGEQMMRDLQKSESDSWRVLVLGARPEEEISQCLFAADFGVSAVPPEFVFKSGTVAAMVEHGLPVVATRPSYRYRNVSTGELLDGPPHVARDFQIEGMQKTRPGSLLPAVAGRFLDDLRGSRR